MVNALEPTVHYACHRPGCPYTITDEETVVDDAIGEHEAMHARLARRTDRCSHCTCHVDEHNRGCPTCKQRHRSRGRRA